jgi:hypothetical protein
MGRADIGVSQLGQCTGSGLAVKRPHLMPMSHAASPTKMNAEMM